MFYFGPDKCFRPNILKTLEATGNWVLQRKKDGCWCCLILRNGSPKFLSRTRNRFNPTLVGTRLPKINWKNVNAILIGELETLTTRSSIVNRIRGFPIIYIYDIVEHNGKKVNFTFKERNKIVTRIVNEIDDAAVQILETIYNDFENVFDKWTNSENEEGAIAKHLLGKLSDCSPNGRTNKQMKIKRNCF